MEETDDSLFMSLGCSFCKIRLFLSYVTGASSFLSIQIHSMKHTSITTIPSSVQYKSMREEYGGKTNCVNGLVSTFARTNVVLVLVPTVSFYFIVCASVPHLIDKFSFFVFVGQKTILDRNDSCRHQEAHGCNQSIYPSGSIQVKR